MKLPPVDPLATYFLVTKKEETVLNFFWLGFVIYTVFFNLAATEVLPYVFAQMFQVVGLLLTFPALAYLIRFRFTSNYQRFIFSAYMLWSLVVVMRGISFDYVLIKSMLFEAKYGVLFYFAPVVMLMPKNLYYYKKLFDVITLFMLISVGLYIIKFGDLINRDLSVELGKQYIETYAKALAIPAAFILMTFTFHSYRRRVLAFVVLGLTLAFALIQARRGLIVFTMLPLTATYFIYLYWSKIQGVLVIISIAAALALNVYAVNFVGKSEFFYNVRERAFENTRIKVERRFFQDMKGLDWVVGRGMSGTYYCPEVQSDDPKGYRRVIETGFLQTVLKGGVLSLLLQMLLLIPAAFKGLFRSKNLLAKAAGLWILINIVSSYPLIMESFYLHYILVWICVGICYSDVIRNLPQHVLQYYFTSRTS